MFVGISKYEKTVNNLSYCHRDAIEMYEMLKMHTTSDRLILLNDAQAKNDSIVSYTKRLFQQAKAKRKLIFANACSSGTLRQSGRQASSKSVNPGNNNNVLLFLSSRSNQDSFEDLTLRNSIFTYYLLAGLKGGADLNRDTFFRIALSQIAYFLADKNYTLLQLTNGQKLMFTFSLQKMEQYLAEKLNEDAKNFARIGKH